jgi:putative phosphoesterase
MILGVVSDTHGHVENAQRAVRMLESFSIEQVLHCGDIGSDEIPQLFSQWPTSFVFGNVDYHQAELRSAIKKAKLRCYERFGQLELASRKVALLHSDDLKLFQSTVSGGQFDLVCYGHTHIAKQDRVGNTLVLNPGALYRAPKHTIAIVDLKTMEANIVSV